MAELYEALRAEHVDGDGELESLVELDRRCRVEDDGDAADEELLVRLRDAELGLCDVTGDRHDF